MSDCVDRSHLGFADCRVRKEWRGGATPWDLWVSPMWIKTSAGLGARIERAGKRTPKLKYTALNWCGRGDLNPHAFRRHPLKMVCLPVPPLPHCEVNYGAMSILEDLTTLHREV